LSFYSGTLFTVLVVVVPVVNSQQLYTMELEHYLAENKSPEKAFSF